MDPEITNLAATAGTTFVTLLATDAWQGVRDGVVALWQRARPERAEAIAGELEATREEIVAAGDDSGQTEAELIADWQGRLRRLLAARPELAGELRALLAEYDDGSTGGTSGVTLNATASGQARVFQAGRDMRMGGQ